MLLLIQPAQSPLFSFMDVIKSLGKICDVSSTRKVKWCRRRSNRTAKYTVLYILLGRSSFYWICLFFFGPLFMHKWLTIFFFCYPWLTVRWLINYLRFWFKGNASNITDHVIFKPSITEYKNPRREWWS